MILLRFFKTNKVVLSCIDSPRRDFGWRLLMAKKLADQGISTVLGKPHDIFLILSILRKALVFGRFGGNTGRGKFDVDLVKQIELTRSSMFFLHDEGAFYYKEEYESAVRRIYPEEYFSKPFLKKVFFWGDRQRSIFNGVYEDCSLDVSGAPRLDYLRFLLAKKPGKPKTDAKFKDNYVLICSRFAGISPARDDVSLISDNFLNIRVETEASSETSVGDLFRQQVKRWCSVSIDRAHFIDAIYDLAKSYPESEFIFRPHPGEDASLYRTLYRFLDNVIVDKSGDLSELLQEACLFIHSESTSGVEAAVIGVPSINFSSREDGGHTVAGASEVGEKVKDSNELRETFTRLLTNPKSSLQEDSQVLAPYVKNSTSDFNAIDKVNGDIVGHFDKNSTRFRISVHSLNKNFWFYLLRKLVYFFRSMFNKVGYEDKSSGFNKRFIYKQWRRIGGKSGEIKILFGFVFILPRKTL